VVQAVLTLRAYMDLDAGAPFEVYAPPVEDIPIEQIADLQPEAVYSLALAHQPLQKMDALLIESDQKFARANKGAMYPQVSLFGNVNTTYTTAPVPTEEIYNIPFTHAIGYVYGANTPVLNDSVSSGRLVNGKSNPYFTQLNSFLAKQVGVSINIPILNNGIYRTNYAKSKLTLRNQELQRDQDNLTLKNNIYVAYTSAITALQKFEANKITVAATQKSYDFAQKRYSVGMLNTIDLLTNQNNFFNARINLLSSQFDYVFKMKVLEYYKGLGVKLTKD
jgi:outer membrane protein